MPIKNKLETILFIFKICHQIYNKRKYLHDRQFRSDIDKEWLLKTFQIKNLRQSHIDTSIKLSFNENQYLA